MLCIHLLHKRPVNSFFVKRVYIVVHSGQTGQEAILFQTYFSANFGTKMAI